MAGEIFIAKEETSQEIKTAVEGVNTSVTELKEDVGDGAGTDLVTRVANLEAKVNSLQTTVESIPTSSDIATIVKNNAGGTSFKPIKVTNTTRDDNMISLSTGKTYKLFFVSNGGSSFSISCRSGTPKVKINGKTISISGQLTLLPLHQIIEITVVSGSPYIAGVGTVYEVE